MCIRDRCYLLLDSLLPKFEGKKVKKVHWKSPLLYLSLIHICVENINDAAHTLGVIDSAMNKLEALENVNYIDQDGTDRCV